jgi:hypothetical protein
VLVVVMKGNGIWVGGRRDGVQVKNFEAALARVREQARIGVHSVL